MLVNLVMSFLTLVCEMFTCVVIVLKLSRLRFFKYMFFASAWIFFDVSW